MDDDITFGASVWATSEPVTTIKLEKDVGFADEFEDFGASADPTQGDLNDDFGDFGDFGEVELDSSEGFADNGAFNHVLMDDPSSQNWHPLILHPFPSRPKLESVINDTLGPIWNYEDIADVTTDDPIRETEGIAQILITPSSRAMYKTLLQTPPPTKPPNWTRSRIRRQHLITLGVPVNLDEVLPRSSSKPLPPLEIHTRPPSAPPNRSNSLQSRDGTPQPAEQEAFAQFGPKPELDMTRINKLLQLNAEQLTMQPLANVERYLAEIKLQTANTSKLLTYLLQSRDALQQDSETYNGLIAEMVGQAQSLRSGKPPRTASIRRGNNGLG